MSVVVASAHPRRRLRDRAKTRSGEGRLVVFRVADEWYAIDLSAVDEVIETPVVHHVPDGGRSLLGVVQARRRSVPYYDVSRLLRSHLRSEEPIALILRARDMNLAIAVDDVDDVVSLAFADLLPVPTGQDGDGLLLGLFSHRGLLVAMLDARGLVESFRSLTAGEKRS